MAKHDIPAMVELKWEKPQASRRRGSGAAIAPVASVTQPEDAEERRALAAIRATAEGGKVSRGAGCLVEVLQKEAALRGSRFAARVVSAERADGLVKVCYLHLYETAEADLQLVEWLDPSDPDEARRLSA